MRATLTDSALTLAVAPDEVIAWDRAGRLYTVWRDGRTSRRGLSGRILRKWRDPGATRREWLDRRAAAAVVDHAASRARTALTSGLAAPVSAALERAAAFDSRTADADAWRFREIYSPIGILPPDQYLASVVQATEGCTFRTCEFCDLFDHPFRVRPFAEFETHVRAVRDYMGASLTLRGRSVFLGAANALALPVATLRRLLEIISDEFRVPVAGFLDGHTGAKKSAGDYRDLATRGLRRVYVGLESGHDPLLALVRKPTRAAEVLETVAALKAGGVSVAVIVIVGLGGREFSNGHVEDTIDVLNAMALGRGDLIYFSDLVVSDGSRFEATARRAGLTLLDDQGRRIEREQIRNGLRFNGPPPQISTYDIREFVS